MIIIVVVVRCLCYHPHSHTQCSPIINNTGPGVLVCSIDNMPTQLPLESTTGFGDMLGSHIMDIVFSDATQSFDEWECDPVVKGATIASNGTLTPNFKYIADLRAQKNQAKFGKRATTEKTVLVLGAGFVAGPLVEMLTRDKGIHVIVASDLQCLYCLFSIKYSSLTIILHK